MLFGLWLWLLSLIFVLHPHHRTSLCRCGVRVCAAYRNAAIILTADSSIIFWVTVIPGFKRLIVVLRKDGILVQCQSILFGE